MSRFFTPAPQRVTRAGTFDGMEKLFFDNGKAIETGEMTAPPEAMSVPATPIQGGLRKIQGLSIFQKVGLGLAGSVLIAGAVLVFGGGSKPTPIAQPAVAVVAAPATAAPAPAAVPPVVASKPAAAKVHHVVSTRVAHSKHVATVSAKKKTPARTPTSRWRKF